MCMCVLVNVYGSICMHVHMNIHIYSMRMCVHLNVYTFISVIHTHMQPHTYLSRVEQFYLTLICGVGFILFFSQ